MIQRGVQFHERGAALRRQGYFAAGLAGITGASEIQRIDADVPIAVLRPERQRAGQLRQHERLTEFVRKLQRECLCRQLQRQRLGIATQLATHAAHARQLADRVDAQVDESHIHRLQSGGTVPAQRDPAQLPVRMPAAQPLRQRRRQRRLQRQPWQQRRQLQLARGHAHAGLRAAGLVQAQRQRAAVVTGPAHVIAIAGLAHAGQSMQRGHVGGAAGGRGHRQRVQIQPDQAAAQLAVAPVEPGIQLAAAVISRIAVHIDAVEQGLQLGAVDTHPHLAAAAVLAKTSGGAHVGSHTLTPQHPAKADLVTLAAQPQLPG